MSQTKKLQVGLFQLPIGSNVTENVKRAVTAIQEAKAENPRMRLAVLAESFNAPYGMEAFSKNPESIPDGPTCQALSKLAQTLGIYIIGGTIIERVKGTNKLYNTCTVWSPMGKLIGKHRKVHLFMVNIDAEHEGGCEFDESAVLTAGDEITMVDIDNHKVGIGICHDSRFDELARLYRLHGCEMIVYPAAFCICQGPMHWELVQRSRANDNQVFVVTCQPSQDNMAGYVSYGHSMIVDPWGRVQREGGSKREVIIEELDFTQVDEARRQIPLFEQRRTDIYTTQLVRK